MELDARGLKCPLPIVRLTQAIKSTSDPEIRVTSDDPAFEADVAAWCRKTGHALASLVKEGRVITAVVRKGGA